MGEGIEPPCSGPAVLAAEPSPSEWGLGGGGAPSIPQLHLPGIELLSQRTDNAGSILQHCYHSLELATAVTGNHIFLATPTQSVTFLTLSWGMREGGGHG